MATAPSRMMTRGSKAAAEAGTPDSADGATGASASANQHPSIAELMAELKEIKSTYAAKEEENQRVQQQQNERIEHYKNQLDALVQTKESRPSSRSKSWRSRRSSVEQAKELYQPARSNYGAAEPPVDWLPYEGLDQLQEKDQLADVTAKAAEEQLRKHYEEKIAKQLEKLRRRPTGGNPPPPDDNESDDGKERKRRRDAIRRRTQPPSDPDDSSDSDGDDRARGTRSPAVRLCWKRFSFKPDKSQYLKGATNFRVFFADFRLALKAIGWKEEMKLTSMDEVNIAVHLRGACNLEPKGLIVDIEQGTKAMKRLESTYAQSADNIHATIWGKLRTLKYDGKDPIKHVTEFRQLVHDYENGGSSVNDKDKVTWFLASLEDKAIYFVRLQRQMQKMVGVTAQYVMDEFAAEFYHKIGDRRDSSSKSGNSHNAQGKKKGKRDKSGIECFGCGKTGHFKHECKSSKRDKEAYQKKRAQQKRAEGERPSSQTPEPSNNHTQPKLPDGVRTLLDGNTYSVRTSSTRLVEEAILEHEDQLQQVTKSHAAPQSTSMITQSHSADILPSSKHRILFDTGSDIHITNCERDFLPGTMTTLKKKFPILTGGGAVYAEKVGAVKYQVTGPKGENHYLVARHVFLIPSFPLKIFSGESFFKAGGYLEGNSSSCVNIMGSSKVAITTLNIPKRGFYLWPYGQSEPGRQPEGGVHYTCAALYQFDQPEGAGLEAFSEQEAYEMKAAIRTATVGGQVMVTDELTKQIVLWHRRLCHISAERLIWTIRYTTGIELDHRLVEVIPSIACDLAKIKKISSKDVQKRLRHRHGKTPISKVRNKDNNVVDDDVTDDEGVIRRKRGRPRKHPAVRHATIEEHDDSDNHFVLEAPPDDFLRHCWREGVEDDEASQFSAEFLDSGRLVRVNYTSADISDQFADTNPTDRAHEAMNTELAKHWLEQEYKDIFEREGSEDILFGMATQFGLQQIFEILTVKTPDAPTFKDAMEGPEKDAWIEAIFTEIRTNLEKGTFRFCDKSEAIKGHLIDAKWVLKKKYLSTGELERLKGRIVARGFSQRRGIDYNETSATTARATSWRILMALASIFGWHVYQIDFIAAYLNGKLYERIFMKQFPLLKQYFDAYPDEKAKYKYEPEKTIELMNPLYGLKQAGATWQREARRILKKLGFTPLQYDDAIYINRETGDIIASYVDDFLLFGPNKQRLQQVAKDLARQVPLNDLGDADWFLGVRITRGEDDSVNLDQRQYIEKAVESLGFTNAKPMDTPFEPSRLNDMYMGAVDQRISPERTTGFSSMVGKFNFSSVISRPDTSFATSAHARYMCGPTAEQEASLKRVPRYLKGNRLAIEYRRDHRHQEFGKLGLHGAVDSSYAGKDGAKSTSGYVFFMAGGPISWLSKLQTVVARGTTEAEFVALSMATADAAWIRNFLTELGYMPEGPIVLLEDNTGAIKWSNDSSMTKEKRHIRVAYHYVTQEVNAGNVAVRHVASEDNAADGLTKPLDKAKHQRFIELLGLVPSN